MALVGRRRRRSRSSSSAAGLGYYLYVQGKARDIRGSSTVEFVPTEPPPTTVPTPKPRRQARHARARGADARRLADLRLRRAAAAVPAEPAARRRSGSQWTFHGAAPARVPARRRLRPRVHREQPGRALRRPGGDRADELALRVGPLRRRVAGGRGRGRLHGVPEHAAQGQRRLQRRSPARRASTARWSRSTRAPGSVRWRRIDRRRARPRRSSPDGRVYVGDWTRRRLRARREDRPRGRGRTAPAAR